MSVTSLSYSHDLTREEIIARYRERISQGKRSKLGKTELDQLMGHFLDRLRQMEDQDPIKALCDAEIALLEEGYAQSTVAFDYIPKYRKAIETVIAEGIIPVTPTNSHRYIRTQRVTGIEEERYEHYALTYFKYDEATYEALDSRSRQTNRHRQLNLKGVNPWLYLDKLNELLHSEHKFVARHTAIAIAGLTGRRIGEVTARGRFTTSSHPYLLRFEGHSKTEREAYDIVTLIPAIELLPSLEQFRTSAEVEPLLNLTGEQLTGAINQFDVQVNRECKRYLGEIVPPLEGREGVSVHNLRSLWGAIAAYFFCPPTSHEYPFLQHYLGHVIESAATGHYFRYRLVDEKGKILEDRGIYIAQCGELPLPSQSQSKVIDQTDSSPLEDEVDATVNTDQRSGACELPTQPEVASGWNAAMHSAPECIQAHSPDTDATELEQQQLSLPVELESAPTPNLALLPALIEDEALSDSLEPALQEMLYSERYTILLTALMAVTGRSPGELLKAGVFKPLENEAFALSFSPTGIAKHQPLVTLVDAAVVLDGIQRLRHHNDTQALLYQAPSSIDAHCQLYVTKAITQYLPFDGIEQMFEAYSHFTQITAASLPQPKPQPQTTIYHIYPDDKQRLGAIALQLGFEGTQPEVFHALFDWVESHLQSSQEDGKAQREPEPAQPSPLDETLASTLNNQATTLAWLTREIESLRGRCSHLEGERDELKGLLEKASESNPELEQLKADNSHLEAQLSQATSKLEGFRRLLNGNGDSQPTQAPVTTPAQQKAIAQSTPTPQPPPQDTHSTPKPHKGGKAKERAMRIFQALQQWNQNHPDQTFALNCGLLEVTFRINRKAAQEFIAQNHSLIEAYHAQIGVDEPFSHNRGKDASQLKAFALATVVRTDN